MNTQSLIDSLIKEQDDLLENLQDLNINNNETITSLEEKIANNQTVIINKDKENRIKVDLLEAEYQQKQDEFELASSHYQSEQERFLELKKQEAENNILIKSLADKKDLITKDGETIKNKLKQEIELLKQAIPKRQLEIDQINVDINNNKALIAHYHDLEQQHLIAQNNANYHSQFVYKWQVIVPEKRYYWLNRKKVEGWVVDPEQLRLRDQYQNQANQLIHQINILQPHFYNANYSLPVLYASKQQKNDEIWLYHHEIQGKNQLLSINTNELADSLELIDLQKTQAEEDLAQLKNHELPAQEQIVQASKDRITAIESKLEELTTKKELAQQQLNNFINENKDFLNTNVSLESLQESITKVTTQISNLKNQLTQPNQSTSTIEQLNQTLSSNEKQLEQLQQYFQLLTLEELEVIQDRLQSFNAQLADEISATETIKINTTQSYADLVDQLVEQAQGLTDLWYDNLKNNHKLTIDIGELFNNNINSFNELATYIENNLADPDADYSLSKVELNEAIALQAAQVKYKDALQQSVDNLTEAIELEQKALDQIEEVSEQYEHLQNLTKYEQTFVKVDKVLFSTILAAATQLGNYHKNANNSAIIVNQAKTTISEAIETLKNNSDEYFDYQDLTQYLVSFIQKDLEKFSQEHDQTRQENPNQFNLNGYGFLTKAWLDLPGNVWHHQWEIADFNDDGKSDIIVVNPTNDYQVSISNGNSLIPTFSVDHNGNLADHQWKIGDFNGDKKSDLVVANPNNDYSISISDGQAFSTNLWLNHEGELKNSQWNVADFNGDGKSDLIVANATNDYYVSISNGDGFLSNLWLNHAGNLKDHQWQLGDFNGDGKTDLIVADSANDYYVAISNGNSFITTKWLDHGGNLKDHQWKLGDLNGDGKTDLIIADSANDYYVAISNGNSFIATKWLDHGGNLKDHQWKLGDLNGDGKTDLVMANAANDYHVSISNGNSFITTKWLDHGGNLKDHQWQLGDLNGDGKTDLVMANYTNDYHVSISTGQGFITSNWLDHGGSLSTHQWKLGDFNGDKKTDLVMANDVNDYHISITEPIGSLTSFHNNIKSKINQIELSTNLKFIATLKKEINNLIFDLPNQITLSDTKKEQEQLIETNLVNYIKNRENQINQTINTAFSLNEVAPKVISDYQILRLETSHFTLLAEKNPDKIQKYLFEYTQLHKLGATFDKPIESGPFNIVTPLGHIYQDSLRYDHGAQIFSGDYNGDGKTDFIRQEHNGWGSDTINTFQIYFSKGDGTFNVVTPTGDIYQNALRYHPGAFIIPGDYNGDGKTDFIRQEHSSLDNNINTFQIYFSKGDGTFDVVTPTGDIYQNALRYNPGAFIIPGDYNGDGKTDFIRQEHGSLDNNINTFQIYFSKGDGTFDVVTPIGDIYQNALRYNPGAFIIPGDYNGDGKTDFIRQEHGSWDDTINTFQIYFSKGDGTFNVLAPIGDQYQHLLRFNHGAFIIPGDYNGDGKTDFIRQEHNAWAKDLNISLQIYFSNGDGTFQIFTPNSPLYQDLLRANFGANIIPADYNGDGYTDFIRQERGGLDDDTTNSFNVYFADPSKQEALKSLGYSNPILNLSLQSLRNQHFPELQQADTINNIQQRINQNINHSEQNIAQLKVKIQQQQAQSNAMLSQASWYEEESAIHWHLSHKAGPTWEEKRTVKGKSGRTKTITITHVDHHWIIWDAYTKQAAVLRTEAANILRGLYHDTRQKDMVTEILKQWEEVNKIADQASITQEQLLSLLNQLEVKRELNADKKQQIADLSKLLDTLQSQLESATQRADQAKQTVTKEWTEFSVAQEDYQNALSDILPRRIESQVKGQELLQEFKKVNRWITQQNYLLDQEIQQVEVLINLIQIQRDVIVEQLQKTTDQTLVDDLVSRQNLLNNSINLLSQKQIVLTALQATFIQKQNLLTNQEQVIETQYKLLDAYIESPDNDTSSLEQFLVNTKTTLAEIQKLAEIAETSSNAVTDMMNDLHDSLLIQNDRYLKEVKYKQTTLQDLVAKTELKENLTVKANEQQQELNSLQTQVIDILRKAESAGAQEVALLLEATSRNNMSTAYEIIYRDYSDLASDKGGWCVKGIARPQDRQIAADAYQKMLNYRQLKTQAEQQISQFTQIRLQAESQINFLKQQENLVIQELTALRQEIGNVTEKIEAAKEQLLISELRVEYLAQIRTLTEQTLAELLSVEQLNLAQAKLQQEIAEKRDQIIDDALKAQLNKQLLDIERDRQIAVAKLEHINQIKAEEALQTQINNFREGLGLTPIDHIINQAEFVGELAGILTDINRLSQTQPTLPSHLQTLLAETSQDITTALQGGESQTIQKNLLQTSNDLITQATQLNEAIAQLDKEELEYEALLIKSETNLQAATKQLYDEIQRSGVLNQEKEILTAKNLENLYKVAYAHQAGAISQELAQQSKEILTQIIDIRIKERKARKKAFINELFGITSLVVSIAGAAITGGMSLGLLPASFALKTVGNILVLTSSVIGAAQSAYNGDWAGALFKTVMGFSSFVNSTLTLGLAQKNVVFGLDLATQSGQNIANNIISNINIIQPIAKTAFNALRAHQSGDNISALLHVMGGLAELSLDRLSFVSDTIPYQIINSLQKVPMMIYEGIKYLEDDKWIKGIHSIFEGIVTIGKNFANTLSSDQFKDLSKILNTLELGENIGFNIATAIEKGDIQTWVSSIYDILQSTTNYVEKNNKIEESFIKILEKEKLLIKEPLSPQDPLAVKYGADNVWKDGNNNLFIRQTITIDNKSVEVISIGEIDPTKITLVSIHGFNQKKEDFWQLDLSQVAKAGKFKDANIIIINWGDLAHVDYFSAAKNTSIVGEAVAHKLHDLGIKGENLYLVGKSLGGHVSGIIGEVFQKEFNEKVKEIVGLDPARPNFETLNLIWGNNPSLDQRLDKNDAETVKIIHTTHNSLFSLGYRHDAGTEDYYLSNAQSNYYKGSGSNHSDGELIYIDFLKSQSTDFAAFFEKQQQDLLSQQISSQSPKISVLLKEFLDKDTNKSSTQYKTYKVDSTNLNITIPDLTLPSDSNSLSNIYRISSINDLPPIPKDNITNIVESSITYTIPTGIDNLSLTGTSAIDGTGNNLKNSIIGNNANNIISGLGGDDILIAGDGHDTLHGGDGHDTLYGDAGNDILNGDTGNDFLYDEIGNDSLFGGIGNDVLFDGSGDDLLNGGDGNDTLYSNIGANLLNGGIGNDTYNITQASGGSIIEDSQSRDRLIIQEINNFSLSMIKREGTSVIIDLNQDNIFSSAGDLTIRNFYGADGVTAGTGFIEIINNVVLPYMIS